MPVLEVENLTTRFHTEDGVVTAVDGVSWSVDHGQTVAVVGESGCGKSVTALSLMRLIPDPPGEIVAGAVRLDGTDLLSLTERQMLDVRGNAISMIFQEPMASLNPLMPVGKQIVEAIREHQPLSRKHAGAKAIDTLTSVGIPNARERFKQYPYQLSGGMRQRVMIAMALACDTQVLIADEPTTALDVTIQAQIIDLLKEIQRRRSISIVLITHDMGVVAELAHKVVVMYAGNVIERAPVDRLFDAAAHPYTQGLLRSIPTVDRAKPALETIEGTVPSLAAMPPGCRFAPRCPHAMEVCRRRRPLLEPVEHHLGHHVACWLYHTGAPDEQ